MASNRARSAVINSRGSVVPLLTRGAASFVAGIPSSAKSVDTIRSAPESVFNSPTNLRLTMNVSTASSTASSEISNSFAASLSAALAGRAFPVKRVCNFEKISISSIASFMRALAALVWHFKIHSLQPIRGKFQQVRLSIALNKTVSVGIADHLSARPLSGAFCRWPNSASRLTGWPLPNWNMAVANSNASSNAAAGKGCIVAFDARPQRSTSRWARPSCAFCRPIAPPLQYERIPGEPLRKKMTLTKSRRSDLSH